VSLADWLLGRRAGTGLTGRELGAYVGAQMLGGVAGAVLANLMYEVPVTELATTQREGVPLLLGEVVATAGLVALIFALARTGRGFLAAPAVGAYIGAVLLVRYLFPDVAEAADDVVVPHPHADRRRPR
jgi:glycerol uptake facilitator-like aquaporin